MKYVVKVSALVTLFVTSACNFDPHAMVGGSSESPVNDQSKEALSGGQYGYEDCRKLELKLSGQTKDPNSNCESLPDDVSQVLLEVNPSAAYGLSFKTGFLPRKEPVAVLGKVQFKSQYRGTPVDQDVECKATAIEGSNFASNSYNCLPKKDPGVSGPMTFRLHSLTLKNETCGTSAIYVVKPRIEDRSHCAEQKVEPEQMTLYIDGQQVPSVYLSSF